VKPGTVKPSSKTQRIVEFFERNPGEVLTMDDLVAKFELGSHHRARGLLHGIRVRSNVLELELVRTTVVRVKAQEPAP
jgi:hypothetical protein